MITLSLPVLAVLCAISAMVGALLMLVTVYRHECREQREVRHG